MRKRNCSRSWIAALEFAGVIGQRRGHRALVFGVFVFGAVTALQAVPATAQVNAECTTSGSTANCDDITADGIIYTGPTITTVNVNDLTAGTVAVTSGTGGIRLQELGALGAAGTSGSPTGGTGSSVTGTLTVDNEADFGTSGGADAINVLSRGGTGGSAVTAAGGGGKSGGSGGSGGTVRVLSDGTITASGNDAQGIRAVSIGGNGGNGSGAGGIIVATGGNGGTGGAAGVVEVTLRNNATTGGVGDIRTTGTGSHGILAQSRGGDGGGAGGAGSLGGSSGGKGGGGGIASTVTVTTEADTIIQTTGTSAHGVLALSEGGNGKNGAGSGAAGGAFGGDGGAGGNADAVTVNIGNNSDITTSGQGAFGVLARSEGGDGAKGGGSGAAIAAEAGDGGAGGSGKAVRVNIAANSDINTTGVSAHAVVAQSLGGSGGQGGGAGALVGLAGGGGLAGGSSGGLLEAVIVDNDGTIGTTNSTSIGIVAQSIAGGGGTAGGGGGLVAIGADGGGAVNAGGVKVDNSGTVTTQGDGSTGYLAQSIGGGGGSSRLVGGLVAVGGSGEAGGDGGKVTVIDTGTVTTGGDKAAAILAQSIGGGGGNAGSALGVGAFVSVAVGGNGGAGGDGDVVDVSVDSALATTGDVANAITAQSIGGGGGNGGDAYSFSVGAFVSVSVGVGGQAGGGGDGDTVKVTTSASTTIDTGDSDSGDRSRGILAQSIGGGGGEGGSVVTAAVSGGIGGSGSVSVGVAAKGGGGGSGKKVTVNNSAQIRTRGDMAQGIYAQSVGGGGGDGGYAIAVPVSLSDGVAISVGTAVGGGGGVAGTGGAVEVTNANAITTGGDLSTAIFAQSVGGGGGTGGMAISAAVAIAGGSGGGASVAVGGGGGSGGTADKVTVSNSAAGTIVTAGDNSDGISASSIGGGGGDGGLAGSGTLSVTGGTSASFAVSVGGAGGTGNKSGLVDVDNAGNITTKGDRAQAILAQSVGGGGGDGGGTIALTGAFTGGGSGLAASVGVGGVAGAGSDGDIVEVTSKGNLSTGELSTGGVITSGFKAHGIHATSIGGSGGSGGFAVTAAASAATQNGGSIGVSVGATGGTGGKGSNVGVGVLLDQTTTATRGNRIGTDSVTGSITVRGDQAHGISANSIGGGGGDGGFAGAFTGAFNGSNSKALTASVAVGGKGAGGGSGGKVFVDNAATINIFGNRSSGIVARSLGGGGGTGGGSATANLAIFKDTFNVGVAVGGRGGAGDDADDVDVKNTGDIKTVASSSQSLESDLLTRNGGIVAQSIGGGGGDGGFAFSASAGGEESKTVTVGVGGAAGNAGKGKNVKVVNEGKIETSGTSSHGIAGQSIGGGGGTGGAAMRYGAVLAPSASGKWTVDVGVTIGGQGGSGATSGKVEIENKNTIKTTGLDSHGIFAQSIGGGGGTGGASYGFGLGLNNEARKGRQLAAQVAIGGKGGTGNTADEVKVTNSALGAIETTGDGSHGILAHSIGGSGGDGGVANAINIQLDPGNFSPFAVPNVASDDWAFEVAVGGNGGTSANGGKATVDNSATIITRGAAARGIWAQSIGGGGGNGGQGALSTGNPTGDLIAAIATCLPCNISSLLAVTDLSVIVGGNAGVSGDAEAVKITNSGNITTLDYKSHAIFAQSIGGGGGEAMMWAKDQTANPATGGNAGIGPNGKVGLGGEGGAAGDGGTVDVIVTGGALIDTSGNEAHGIFAQSIGGGGGAAGNIDRSLPSPVSDVLGVVGEKVGFADLNNMGIGLALLRNGGNAGDGKKVNIDSTSNITTRGSASIGIFAQSIGGGGGVAGGDGAGPSLSVGNFAGSVGGNGSGGKVVVTHTGNITTSGNHITDGDAFSDASHGIFAQSAGGVNADTVDVTLNGTIVTTGRNSIGILAQSVGNTGTNGNVTITINSSVTGGTVVGLDPTLQKVAAGVRILDGATNSITSSGLITTQDGLAGLAIGASGGDETVDNSGTVTGNVDLGTGTNAFNNKTTSSLLNSGLTIDLGSNTNLLTNEGVWSPGGALNVQTTTMTGKIDQTATGSYAVDLDFAKTGLPGESDLINATGAATLAGSVDLSYLNVGSLLPGTHQVTILSAAGNVTNAGLTLNAITSAVATFQLLFPSNNTDVDLGYTIDFAPPGGLNPNQTSMGNNINDIQTAGGSPAFSPIVTALFSLPDIDALADAYDQLSPEIYADTEISTLYSSFEFSDNLLSCRVNGTDTASINREGNCLWVGARARHLDRDRTFENIGFDETAGQFAVGAQVALDPVWRLGFGVGYQRSTLETHTGGESDGDQVQGGVALKYNSGGLLLAGVVSGGRGWYDTTRPMAFGTTFGVTPSGTPIGTFSATAESDHEIDVIAGRLHASYVVGSPSLYAKPLIDAAVTRLDRSDVTETGAGGANLIVAGNDHTVFSVSPALELGTEWWLSNGTLVRPFVRAGATWFSDDDVALTASFAGAPTGVGPFAILSDMDEVQADIAAGLELINGTDDVLRVYYDGHFGDKIEIHSVGLKGSARF